MKTAPINVEGNEIGIIKKRNKFVPVFESKPDTPTHEEGGMDIKVPIGTQVFNSQLISDVKKAMSMKRNDIIEDHLIPARDHILVAAQKMGDEFADGSPSTMEAGRGGRVQSFKVTSNRSQMVIPTKWQEPNARNVFRVKFPGNRKGGVVGLEPDSKYTPSWLTEYLKETEGKELPEVTITAKKVRRPKFSWNGNSNEIIKTAEGTTTTAEDQNMSGAFNATVERKLMGLTPPTAALRNLLMLSNNETPSASDWYDTIPFRGPLKYLDMAAGTADAATKILDKNTNTDNQDASDVENRKGGKIVMYKKSYSDQHIPRSGSRMAIGGFVGGPTPKKKSIKKAPALTGKDIEDQWSAAKNKADALEQEFLDHKNLYEKITDPGYLKYKKEKDAQDKVGSVGESPAQIITAKSPQQVKADLDDEAKIALEEKWKKGPADSYENSPQYKIDQEAKRKAAIAKGVATGIEEAENNYEKNAAGVFQDKRDSDFKAWVEPQKKITAEAPKIKGTERSSVRNMYDMVSIANLAGAFSNLAQPSYTVNLKTPSMARVRKTVVPFDQAKQQVMEQQDDMMNRIAAAGGDQSTILAASANMDKTRMEQENQIATQQAQYENQIDNANAQIQSQENALQTETYNKSAMLNTDLQAQQQMQKMKAFSDSMNGALDAQVKGAAYDDMKEAKLKQNKLDAAGVMYLMKTKQIDAEHDSALKQGEGLMNNASMVKKLPFNKDDENLAEWLKDNGSKYDSNPLITAETDVTKKEEKRKELAWKDYISSISSGLEQQAYLTIMGAKKNKQLGYQTSFKEIEDLLNEASGKTE